MGPNAGCKPLTAIENLSSVTPPTQTRCAVKIHFEVGLRIYFDGRIFWFMRKKLSGSYLAFIVASRW